MFNYATKVGDVRAQASENAQAIKGNGQQIELLRGDIQKNRDEIKREIWFTREQLAETRREILEAIK